MPGKSFSSMYILGGNGRMGRKCVELTNLDGTTSKAIQVNEKADLLFERIFHSVCLVDSDTIVVTGGFGKSESKCELYSRRKNKWVQLPDLYIGRKSHASCSFNRRYVYVFRGVYN